MIQVFNTSSCNISKDKGIHNFLIFYGVDNGFMSILDDVENMMMLHEVYFEI